MTSRIVPTRWDVATAMTTLSMELVEHIDADSSPRREQLIRWSQSINKAKQAHLDLQETCEDLVELGSNTDRLKAMEQALAHTQGQDVYGWRKDRW